MSFHQPTGRQSGIIKQRPFILSEPYIPIIPIIFILIQFYMTKIHMKSKHFILSVRFVLTVLSLSGLQLFAQDAGRGSSAAASVYPIPQKTLLLHDSIAFGGIKIKGAVADNIQKALSSYQSTQGMTVRFKRDRQIQQAEGYNLSITKKEIRIGYKNERGAFYGAQTLAQLLSEATQTGYLPLLSIQDFPDVARRGVVEGFYGTPWSYKDRIAQLQFNSRWKMNTYIYGPKDDLYHSSPNWREPYPTEEANRIKALVQTAKDNEVDFYWAIHPGKDIRWNKQDSLAVLRKFDKMYDLGVRHFAVFFDDISGEGTKAEKQAGLLNYIQQEFIDKKAGVGPLIMCPTEYNKLWADPKPGTYLDILGAQLDKRIEIMWTGNSVIHDITKEGELWINKRIQRKAFVWWNFPVNDYVRNHLLLGPVYGLDKDIKNDISGFVSNPMDKAEASKVALFSVADYCWNSKSYDPKSSWEKAIRQLLPKTAKSYEIFAANNTDPGPSYHNYRRVESGAVSETVDSLLAITDQLNHFPLGLDQFNMQALCAKLASFAPAATDLLQNCSDTVLINEIRPWLQHFESLGKAATALCDLLTAKDLQQAYPYLNDLQKARSEMVAIDKNNNRNPYQPGIVTGGRHLLPWIEKSYFHFAQLFKAKGFKVAAIADAAEGQVYTNINILKNLPILHDIVSGNKPVQALKLSPILEVIKLNPEDYVGIHIMSNQSIENVLLAYSPKKAQLKLQYSPDGNTWQPSRSKEARYIRLINTGNQQVEIKLSKFEIIIR